VTHTKIAIIVIVISIFFATTIIINFEQATSNSIKSLQPITGITCPPNSTISRNGDFYYLTGNIYGSIIIESDNIVLDGQGWQLQGQGKEKGIQIADHKNVTIKNLNINSFLIGVSLENSSFCKITKNNITLCTEWAGVYLINSSNNEIGVNNIHDNWDGIQIDQDSSHNNIYNNGVSNNKNGISISFLSKSNIVSENKLSNNTNYCIGLFWYMDSSSNSYLIRNQIENSKIGITISLASNNTIEENNITNTETGILLSGSSKNRVCQNNLIMNDKNIQIENYISRYEESYCSQDNLINNNHYYQSEIN
jgi:parallel beta-helix repeat protein